jgi:ParB-like chromosome segregation protein Spo0J
LEKESILKVEYRDINDIRPYIKNSRRNSDTIDQVVISIENYGWQQPIVVDDYNTIVAGHSRWLAAKKLKYTQVPVVVFNGSAEQARYYRLLDNRSQENSDWDAELLKGELIDIGDLYPTGFTDKEIEKILGESDSKNELAVKTVFEVVVYCEDEQQQKDLYEYVITELDRPCRILSI